MNYEDLEKHEFKTSDFELVQQDKKITDRKLDTKRTSFAADAFKRFCKNRSSVVGAIFIMILILLSLVVPLVNNHDVDKYRKNEQYLQPKIFEAGTGWWDGCVTFTGYKYDTEFVTDEDKERVELHSRLVNRAIYSISNIRVEGDFTVCDIVYDPYEQVFGDIEGEIAKADLSTYMQNNWCKFDYEVGPSSFERLSDKCPILSVSSMTADGKAYGVISQYRAFGYSSSPKFIFGTDANGHDLFKLCFRGLSKSLLFATVVAAICFSFGIVWGAICGYFGGTADLLMERFTDILGSIPMICVITMIRLKLGDALWVFGLALCITGWMGTAGTTRTQFYRFKGREYVLASRTLGSSDIRLIFKHILPNALGTIVTSAVLMIPGLIFTETSLAYLGLGLQGADSFGAVLAANQNELITGHPMLLVIPSIIIAILMISFNLFGNGLRDALNPSLKGGE